MPDERFRLPGSSYGELVKVIRAYGTLSGAASLDEVSKLAAMHPTQISRNNGFLVAIGILEGGKNKVITSKGQDLARALDHEMPDEIRNHWRRVVLEDEFLNKMLSAVKIRKGMEASTLQAHIAYSAGQPKNPAVMTGADTVIDILVAAGLLKEEDGKLVATAIEEGLSPTVTTEVRGRDQLKVALHDAPASLAPREEVRGIQVTIQIQVQCSPADVEQLGPKLRALLEEISRPASEEPSTGG